MGDVANCQCIDFPSFGDQRGRLSVAESAQDVPFSIERIFWVYDVDGDERRGAHAHKALHQLIVCVAGALEVKLDDGRRTRVIRLDRPEQGLHIPPMIWGEQRALVAGTVYMVFASDHFDDADYIRDHLRFSQLAVQDGQ